MLLACGRPHLYEGWSAAELERPVRDLADAGCAALLLTNAAGSLDPSLEPRRRPCVVTDVVDLQGAPDDEPPVLTVMAPAEAARLAAALQPHLTARPGRYVAVAGPQYETPAEAAWLRAYGEVVGMSTAAEVRAAAGAGAADLRPVAGRQRLGRGGRPRRGAGRRRGARRRARARVWRRWRRPS